MVRQSRNDLAGPALRQRLEAQASEIHRKYGPNLDWPRVEQLLNDRSCVPYPCEVRFDAGPLLPGEFAHPRPKGSYPEDGFTIYVHPVYASQPSAVPYLILHQIVLVHYGQAASPEDAELFGAHALGIAKEDYYRALCDLAEQVGGDELC